MEKTNGDKKVNQKWEKGNKTVREKKKKRREFFNNWAIKEKELKIKILEHELLGFTLSYLMLALW
jgi:hypothetical protein